jgi:hypothetical protein
MQKLRYANRQRGESEAQWRLCYLQTLKETLIKIGAKVVRHEREA